jgi:hypothetical protein
MTSFKQIEANRRNAQRSTGPTTFEGKQRSRANALRHGLTAETVIGVLESAEDYAAFEASIMAEYDPRSVIERELVTRLTSLLWRLRRATAIETGLFEMQADPLAGFRQSLRSAMRSPTYFGRHGAPVSMERTAADTRSSMDHIDVRTATFNAGGAPNLTQCFLRLASHANFAFDRLSRYEVNLWRQAAQVMFALDSLHPARK